jgi:hypothetical protein
MKNFRLDVMESHCLHAGHPCCFYFVTLIFDRELAVAILLLTAMPAGFPLRA